MIKLFVVFLALWSYPSHSTVDSSTILLTGKVIKFENRSYVLENHGKRYRIPQEILETYYSSNELSSSETQVELSLSLKEIESFLISK